LIKSSPKKDKPMPTIVLADDHVLLRNGLASLVQSQGYTVLFEADNGLDFIKKLNPAQLPDIVLMDINMPEMDGYATTVWLKQHYPQVKVLALSMYDNEATVIRMLQSGAKGYILKDCDPSELQMAITSLLNKGFYYSELVSGKLVNAINKMETNAKEINNVHNFTDKETEFLQFICTDLSYKEIADKMSLSPRTIDGYRDNLFFKLKIKTRVGLVIYAIKNHLVNMK
jgi:DNA-binding NarL/FixJ family response regulator